jgi:serine/threonine-protein kinase
MELIGGPSLRKVLTAVGRLSAPEAVAVTLQVLQGLDAAHRAGVVHRDIKPGNIMLDASGRAILMDFGLARRAERQSLTAAGAVLGTPEYMSPEQARGEKADARSDLYSIGIVLYEMLGGKPPFGGKDTIAILRQHVEAPAPPLRDLAQEMPPELEKIMARLLAKQPSERYPDARSLAADVASIAPAGEKPAREVQALLARAAKAVSQPTRTVVVEKPGHEGGAKPAAQVPAGRGDRIRTWVAVISAAVAVLSLLVALAAVMRTRERPREPGARVSRVGAPAPQPGTLWNVTERDGRTFVGELLEVWPGPARETIWSFRLPDGGTEWVAGTELLRMEPRGGENP